MSTQINENIGNDEKLGPQTGIENFPRDINVLLALRTYQGMTDEEIDLLIDYKIQQEKTSAEHLAFVAAQTMRANETVEIQRQSCKNLESMLQSTIKASIPSVEFEQPNRLEFHTTEL